MPLPIPCTCLVGRARNPERARHQPPVSGQRAQPPPPSHRKLISPPVDSERSGDQLSPFRNFSRKEPPVRLRMGHLFLRPRLGWPCPVPRRYSHTAWLQPPDWL